MIIVFNGASNVFMDELCSEFNDFIFENVEESVKHIKSIHNFFKVILKHKIEAVISPGTSPKNILVGLICRIYGIKFIPGIHDVVSHEKEGYLKVHLYNKILCLAANDILVFSKFSKNQLRKLYKNNSQVYRFGAKSIHPKPRLKDIDVIVFGRMLEYQGIKRLPAICHELNDLRIIIASKSIDPSDFHGLNCTVIPEFLSPEILNDLVLRSKVVMMPYESATQSGHIPYSISRFCIPVVTAVGGLSEQVEPFDSVVCSNNDFSIKKFSDLVRINVNRNLPASIFHQWVNFQKQNNILLSEYIKSNFSNE